MILLSKADKAKIVEAIREAERGTTAEIRVQVRPFCLGDPLNAARRAFLRLGMHRTKGRNAVLVFAAPASRKFAIFGDEAVHGAAGQVLWDEAASILKKHFSEGQPGEALAQAVKRIGRDLARFFPASGANPDELPDTVSESS